MAVVAVPNAPYDRDAVFLFAGTKIFGRSKVQLHLKSTFVPSYFRKYESTFVQSTFVQSTKVRKYFREYNYFRTKVLLSKVLLSYFRTFVLPYEKYRALAYFGLNRKKTYFRALPRVVASSIELTLRHDVVHNADDVPTKFRDFKRSGRWFSDPSATFLKPPVKHSPQRSTSLL